MSTMSKCTINDKFTFRVEIRTNFIEQNRGMKYHILNTIIQLNNYRLRITNYFAINKQKKIICIHYEIENLFQQQDIPRQQDLTFYYKYI